jgi:hypothetical protein
MKMLVFSFIIIVFSSHLIADGRKVNISPMALSDKVREAVAHDLGKDSDQWRTRNISSAATWLKNGDLIWMTDQRHEKSVVLFVETNGCALILNNPSGVTQSAVSLISKYAPYSEWQERALKFAEAIKPLVSDPRSYVGSTDFWQRKQPYLESWLQDGKMTPELFKKYCEEPCFEKKSGEWYLGFFLFHPNGGIYRVKANGLISPFCVNAITIESILPATSFYFADEM